MDGKEFVDDNGFKRQSSVGLSIVQVPLGYMFKSYNSFGVIFFLISYWQNFAKAINVKHYGMHLVTYFLRYS